jgi:hypothetical protein
MTHTLAPADRNPPKRILFGGHSFWFVSACEDGFRRDPTGLRRNDQHKNEKAPDVTPGAFSLISVEFIDDFSKKQ